MKILMVAGFESATYFWQMLPKTYVQKLGERVFGEVCEVATRLEAEQYPPDGLLVELRSDTPVSAELVERFTYKLSVYWSQYTELLNIPGSHSDLRVTFSGVMVNMEDTVVRKLHAVSIDAEGRMWASVAQRINISLN